jgi:hypothetical protein
MCTHITNTIQAASEEDAVERYHRCERDLQAAHAAMESVVEEKDAAVGNMSRAEQVYESEIQVYACMSVHVSIHVCIGVNKLKDMSRAD